ncbi:MAG: hypothetical protein C0404_02185 [Verrucomicrobia bacterium]|nr:hypothetical protein [Verrucomicrobiota bacterium]
MKYVAIVSLLGISCLLAFSPAIAADVGAAPSTDEKTNVTTQEQVEVRFQNFKTTAEDAKRGGEERIAAILEMAALNSTNVTNYLVENLSVYIRKTSFRGDDDELKQWPYFYALRRKGEAFAPNVIRFLEGVRKKSDLVLIGDLLQSSMGTEKAKQMLEQEKQKNVGASASPVLQANIDEVLSVLSKQKK